MKFYLNIWLLYVTIHLLPNFEFIISWNIVWNKHTMQGDTCLMEWNMANGNSTNLHVH